MTTKNRKSKGGLRSVSRLYAVQAVYCSIILKCSIVDTIDKFSDCKEIHITENVSVFEMDYDFFLLLIKIANDNLSEIDDAISRNLSNNWEFSRLDNVLKAVLRLGIAELLYLKDIPASVVLNEYIEISKSFFEKSEVSFVNGLLNSVIS